MRSVLHQLDRPSSPFFSWEENECVLPKVYIYTYFRLHLDYRYVI